LLFPAEAEQTMGMPATAKRWTAEEVRALQDESRAWPRYELIDGELLVSPGPSVEHQRAVLELAVRLRDYVLGTGIGEVFTSPADVELRQATIVQPDVFVVPLIDGKRARAWSDVKHLLLACEVFSPGTARYDRVVKRRFFSRVGVDEYWVVDLDAGLIERSRPIDDRVEIITDTLAWLPGGAPAPLSIDVGEFFGQLRTA
jgi:Uma2 family endonuclease